jgi:hypothetical protein
MRSMATRGTDRSPQVRRRPPSTGTPVRPASRPPASIAGTPWRTPPRRVAGPAGLPLLVKVILGFAIIALGGAVLLASTGMLSRAVSGIGSSLAGFLGQPAEATPSPSAVPLPDAPAFAMPTTTYTSADAIDVSGSVPASVTGRAGYTVVVAGGLRGEPSSTLASVAVGETTVFTVPQVPLKVGVNVLSARIVGPTGESPESTTVLVVVDRKAPTVTITAPEDGATVNATTVRITGKTQGNSKLIARNETTGQSISGSAKSDGTFEVKLGIGPGKNAVTVAVTDPAGNTTEKQLTVVQGTGRFSASMSTSAKRISAASLPSDIVFTVIVKDPDGARLPGAVVTFSVSIPGITALTKEVKAGADGRAVYRVTLPPGATPGSAIATALVSTVDYGDTSAKVTFQIID